MSVSLPKNSLDLMQRNAEIRGHFGDDAFFLAARSLVIPETGELEVVIDELCPALINNAHKKSIGSACEAMMTLKQGRSKQMADMGFIALAAGGFVWLQDNHIALLQRDNGAPLLAEHWTNPSGMCGEHPFATADKETAEELALFVPKDKLILRFQAANSWPQSNDNVAKNLNKKGLSSEGLTVDNILLGGDNCQRENGGRTVRIVIGADIQQSEIPHIHLDAPNNLIALNQVFRFAHHDIPLTDMMVIDGESFGRDGGVFKFNDALGFPLVPTTRDYLEQRKPRL